MSRRRRQMVDDDVPRLPRGRGMSLTTAQLIKIAFTAFLLVAVIVMQKPCADAAGKFVSNFDNPDAAPTAKPIPRPDQLDVPGSSGVYVPLDGLSEEETKKAIESARKEAADKVGSAGSAGSAKAGSGSASTGSGSAPR